MTNSFMNYPVLSFMDTNNQGINFLRQSMFEQAITSFRSNLTCIASFIAELENEESRTSSVYSTRSSMGLLNVYTEEIESHRNILMQASEESVLSIFSLPFAFSINSNNHTETLSQGRLPTPHWCCNQAKLISGISLFNLGLTYHIMALHFRSSSLPENERKWTQVSRVYAIAKEVLERVDVSYTDKTQRRVMFAANNNIACASLQLFDNQTSQFFLHHLSELINQYGIDEQQDKLILLNLLFTEKIAMNAAAA